MESFFSRFFKRFELILDTVLLFLKEKTIEHCSSEFLGIYWFFVLVFLGNVEFQGVLGKNLRKEGDLWVFLVR